MTLYISPFPTHAESIIGFSAATYTASESAGFLLAEVIFTNSADPILTPVTVQVAVTVQAGSGVNIASTGKYLSCSSRSQCTMHGCVFRNSIPFA